MNNKYEMVTDQTIKVSGSTLYRIKAKTAFADVDAGELGGYIESEANLDVSGNAWVYGNAKVSGNANVSGNAKISGNAWVFGNAWVSQRANVSGNAKVFGNAQIFGNAKVSGNANVSGKANVSGNAKVFGRARVSGNALVADDSHHLTISPIGSSDSITFMRTNAQTISVSVGCFFGSIEEFREVIKTHDGKENAKAYLLAAELAELSIDLREF